MFVISHKILSISVIGIVFCFTTILPLGASDNAKQISRPEDLNLAMLSVFTNTLTQELRHRSPEQEPLIQQFADTFTHMMMNSMYGDGSNPLIVPLSEPSPAQRRFEHLITVKHPNLFNYAANLNHYLRDLQISNTRCLDSILISIKGELTGSIPPQLGFATDYIAPSSSVRPPMLIFSYGQLANLKNALELDLGYAQNTRYDHTTIGHLIKNFSNKLLQYKNAITSLEEVHENIKKPSTYQQVRSQTHNSLALTTQNQEIFDSLKPEMDSQVTFFLRHFLLMDAEGLDQCCQLFLPLLNVLLKDKEAARILKNQDEKNNQSLMDALKNYNTYHTQLTSYLKGFGRDLKQQTPLYRQEQKALESKGRVTTPKTAEPLPRSTPKSQVTVNNNANQRSKPSRTPKTSTSSTQIDIPVADNDLTDWLINRSSPSTSNVSGKKEYRTPSEQEQKEARKAKGKQEKRERAQTQTHETLETQPQDDDIKKQHKENINPVIFNISGGYDLFESIMTKSYKGEMDPVATLIKTRFGGVAYLSHGRWHFALPHISNKKNTVFTTTLDPSEEHELDVEEQVILSQNEISVKQPRSVITVHNPHKNRNKRLRPYHIEDIKTLFEQGGYTLDTVREERLILNTNSKK